MSLQVEKLEHNMAKLTIEASADDFEKAVQNAYLKNKGKISIPGFRKGKAPRQIIEKMYGVGVFYEDAANELIPQAYREAVEGNDELDIVSRPSIDVTQMEKGKSFIFTAEVALNPEVELGKYKGVKVAKVNTDVTEDEVNEAVDRERERNARNVEVSDRAVQDKDIVTIDFEGFVDGVAFDGGKGTDYDLTIGSHSFIDNFEDQLIGKNIGEECEVNVTFPEQYQEESLQGKPAMFKVTVKAIKEKQMPEADDEFASDVSEFDTIAEYKEDLKKKLVERKEAEAKAQKEDEALKAIVADSKMDIPDAMIETEAEQLVENYAMRLQQQGLSMDMYMKYTGLTREKLLDQMKDQARKNIEARLVLEAVVKAENIEATDDEFNAEMDKMAKQYGMEADKLKDVMGERETKAVRSDLAMQKAVDLILANVEETEKKD
ncbi:trigger factor [Lachnospiraceae bacterium C1.1]|nr:trigger factor [Lachnospiraceae bacterium C1.1]